MNKFIKEQLVRSKDIILKNNGNIIGMDDITDDMTEFEIEAITESSDNLEFDKLYMFTFEGYMVKPTPGFTFHAQWNKGVFIPLRTMCGYVTKKLNKLVYLQLFGSTINNSYFCLRCLKAGKYDVICDDCKRVLNITDTKDLMYINWEGWVPLTSIREIVPITMEELNGIKLS